MNIESYTITTKICTNTYRDDSSLVMITGASLVKADLEKKLWVALVLFQRINPI